MKRGIILLLTGPAHGARLVVCLWSLREFFDGPVTVFTTRPESHEIGKLCAADPRLQVEHRRTLEVRRRKNSSYLTKIKITRESSYETTMFLDADTTVCGDISALFRAAEVGEFCATQFAHWQTTTRTIRKRIARWAAIKQNRYDPQWYRQLIDDALQPSRAVNTGVFAFRREAAILGPWLDLAMVGARTFICDEIALQVLLPRYPHQWLDCRYNCSPIHAKTSDARIRHFHGSKHARRQQGRNLWMPVYEECLRENVARLAEWGPGADRFLKAHLNATREEAT